MNDKPCPKCNGVMVFRLGQFECEDCGHFELPGPTQEELDERALNPFLDKGSGFGAGGGQQFGGINRRKLIAPSGEPSAPPAAEPPPPIFRADPEWRDEDELNRRYLASQALNAEKHTFMAVFFLVTAGMLLLRVFLNLGAAPLLPRLFGALMLALLYTLGVSVPLYYDWDLARKACVGLLVLQILAFTAAVVMSIFAKLLGSSWYLIPEIFLNGWLLWILWRDRRGEEDVTSGGCFWGNPIGWF